MGGEPAAPCPPFRVAATRCGGGAAGAADGRGGGGAAGAARLCGCGGGDFPAQGASRPAQYAAGGGGDGDRQDPGLSGARVALGRGGAGDGVDFHLYQGVAAAIGPGKSAPLPRSRSGGEEGGGAQGAGKLSLPAEPGGCP